MAFTSHVLFPFSELPALTAALVVKAEIFFPDVSLIALWPKTIVFSMTAPYMAPLQGYHAQQHLIFTANEKESNKETYPANFCTLIRN